MTKRERRDNTTANKAYNGHAQQKLGTPCMPDVVREGVYFEGMKRDSRGRY